MDASLATDYSGYTVSINVVCDDSIGVNTGGQAYRNPIDDPIGDTSVFSMHKELLVTKVMTLTYLRRQSGFTC